MASAKTSGLKLCLFAAILLLSFSQVIGDEPTYKDCRPHIDATIRDLASKALNAGEEPPEDLPSHVYGDKESSPESAEGKEESVPQPSVENEQPLPEDSPELRETPKIDMFEAEILKEKVLSEYETDISKIKGLSKMLKGLEKSLKGMKKEALEKYDLEQLKLIQILQEKSDQIEAEESKTRNEKTQIEKPQTDAPSSKSEAAEKKINSEKKKDKTDSQNERQTPKQKVAGKKESSKSKSVEEKSSKSEKGTRSEKSSKPEGINSEKLEGQKNAPVPEDDDVKSEDAEPETEEEESLELTPDEDSEPASEDSEEKVGDDVKEELEETSDSATEIPSPASEKPEKEVVGAEDEPSEPAASSQEVPSVPTQKPVTPTPEYSSPPPATATPVYTPPAAQESDGIINKAVYTLFGRPAKERDPKYAQPWQTHAEHMKMTAPVPEQKTIDTSSGFIGGLINNFVTTIFGKTMSERDPKYAQPWQTHVEHQMKSTVKEEEPAKNVYVYSEGILHKFIALIFGEVKGPRDPKYAEPWQTHEDQQRKFLTSDEEQTSKEEKVKEIATGGIIDSFIRLIFPSDLGTRDPKYAKPWQTHEDNVKPTIDTKPIKVREVEPFGGPIDKLVMIIFNIDKNVERDPKYAQPWQTHQEHAVKVPAPSEPKQKPTGGPLGFGFIDSFITSVFGAVPSVRDEKWVEPWQTHAEHLNKPSSKQETSEKKVVVSEGGLFDSIIQSLFGTPKNSARDSKWAEPWQTHDESAPIVPTTASSVASSKPSTTPSASRPEVAKSPEKNEEEDSEKVQEKELPPQESAEQSFQAADDIHSSLPRKDGIVNRFIYFVFGKTSIERDQKWATPWQSHSEFIKLPEKKEKAVIDTSSGIIGKFLNQFVSVVFGEGSGERDPKYAQPWQSHLEHKAKATMGKETPSKNVYIYSEGILHKVITSIFGDVKGPRDPKYAQPWQTHEDHKERIASTKVKETSTDKSTSVKKVECMGGPIDSLISFIFSIDKNAVRDSKYAEPWQSHSDNALTKRPKSAETESKKIENTARLEFVNVIVESIFGRLSTHRDEKWSQPWQTHSEHQDRLSSKPVEKRQADITKESSNFFENIKMYMSKLTLEVAKTLKSILPSKRQNDFIVPDRSKKVEVKPKTEEKVVKPKESSLPKEKEFTASSARQIKSSESLSSTDSVNGQISQSHQKKSAATSPKDQKSTSSSKPISSAPKQVSPETSKEVKSKVSTDSKEEKTERKSKSLPPKKAVSSTTSVESEVDLKRTFRDKPRVSGDDKVEEVPAPAAAPSPVVDTPTPSEPKLEEEEEEIPPAAEETDDDEEPVVIIPGAPRSRDHIETILGLDATSRDAYKKIDPIADSTLKDLKNIYATSVKPLEDTYKYKDISNRHMSDAQIFGQPLVLMLGPYSTGKSSFLNYLMGIEYTKRALRTGANPSHGVFRIVQYGTEDQELDGTSLTADWSFRSLQKFGQNFVDQLRGRALNVPLLKKVMFVEAPGILEMRRPGERQYPFNDVLQWFIDRADLVLVMFDYTKLDAGYELEAALDQLKGREAQVRILLNKADQIPPEELIKVQGSLFWNLSPLLGASAPPTVYAGSFSSRQYRASSPAKLFQAQEEALLHDIAKAINNRVDNRVAIARRHAVRVRNHAQMVDTYLTTYFNNKGFLTSKHKLAEDIIENPHLYNIYEGMSLITNISRYDLPDPEVYRDFFRVHNLYDFPTLKATCSYLQGCPQDQIDKAISADLPELLNKYRRQLTRAGVSYPLPDPGDFGGTVHASIPVPNKY